MHAIVSYDGTENDTDALALARVLGAAGTTLSLAYVRHFPETEHTRERLAQDDAEKLLATGVRWLNDDATPRHVVLSASTAHGLRDLAEQKHADLIIFGSAYRTAPGHLAPQATAERLLDGGPIAIALAPAGYHDRTDYTIKTVAAVSDDPGDPTTHETAESLAAALNANLSKRPDTNADLVIIGSKPGTATGRVMLSASAAYLLEMLLSPALILPHGLTLPFATNRSIASETES